MSTWYWVWSTSKLHKSAEAKETMLALVQDDDAMETWGTKSTAAGFWCHQCSPCPQGETIVMFSMWEAKAGTSGEDFDKFLLDYGIFDKPKLFNHAIFRIMNEALGGTIVKSKFDPNAEVSGWQVAAASSATVEATGRKTFAANLEETGAIAVDGDSDFYMVWHTLRPGQGEAFMEAAGGMMNNLETMVKGFGANGLQNGFCAHAFVPIVPADGGANFFCIWEVRPEKTLEEIDGFFYSTVMPQFINHNFFKVDCKAIGGTPFNCMFQNKTLSAAQVSAKKVMEIMID